MKKILKKINESVYTAPILFIVFPAIIFMFTGFLKIKEENKRYVVIGIERVEKIKKGEIKIDKNLKIDKFIETKLKNKLEFSEDDYFDIGKKLEELKIEDF